jgi:hypothetical protein
MYTNYAIIQDDKIIEYPVTPDAKHNLSAYWLGGELDGKHYVFCHMGMYIHDPETQYLVEGVPVLDRETGNWYRSFTAVNYSGSDLQKRIVELTQAAQNTVTDLCSKADEHIQNLMLPIEQRDSWVAYKTAVQNVLNQSNAPFKLVWPRNPNILFEMPTAVVEL